MFSILELDSFLKRNNCVYEIIVHGKPIISTEDAAKYFDISKAAPTYIMDTVQGFNAFIMSAKRGRIDFKAIKQELGLAKLKMAGKEMIKKITGYEIGAIPLIGHDLPCVFDDFLLENDYIYGGTGDEKHTLKIVPDDILRLNNVIKHIGVY